MDKPLSKSPELRGRITKDSPGLEGDTGGLNVTFVLPKSISFNKLVSNIKLSVSPFCKKIITLSYSNLQEI